MRKFSSYVLMMTLVLALTACGGKGSGNEAEELLNRTRTRYLEMTGCTGHADITADYGQRVYTYGMDFSWQKDGETLLTLTAPEKVAGTSARIARGETALEYDGVMMATGPLDSAGLTPIDVIPALLEQTRAGYMAEYALEDWDGAQRLWAICRDPEEEPGHGLETQLWFEPTTGALLRGEVSEDGYTVIQSDFTGFTIQGPEEG